MIGGLCAQTGAASASVMSIETISKPINERRDWPLERINTSFVDGVFDKFTVVNEELCTEKTASGFQFS